MTKRRPKTAATETEVYEGLFKPPTMGRSVAPIPIAGPGKLVSSDDGMRVEGFAIERGRLAFGLLVFLGTALKHPLI